MKLPLLLLTIFTLTLELAKAETQIVCISSQGATNLTSDGTSLMDGGFRFELGVFNSDFVPTLENTSEWSANWTPAQRTSYKANLKRYADSFMATSNAAPFTAGTAAYIWGFKGDPVSGEWILFRASNWVWPTIGNGPPAFEIWDAKDATAVIGTVNPSGNPSLMRPVAVSDIVPPKTNYGQWVKEELSGETLVAAHEDADGDGMLNIFEFITGTSPTAQNAPISMPVSIVSISGSRFLQLSVPRRIDRPANLVYEVSEDLKNWLSLETDVAEVSSTNMSSVIRDLVPISSSNPRRFIRLRVTSP